MPKEQKKDMEVAATQAVKGTGRGGKYNFPNTVEPEDPESVHAALNSVLYWYNKGNISKCETDEQVQDRIDQYFFECYETGQRPTVEKLALAIGITRETLHSWETGATQGGRRSDMIKRAKDTIASYDAEMVTAGKMNPVPYIFRAKNYYGMKDQQDLILTPNNPMGEEKTAEDIANAYKQLPE